MFFKEKKIMMLKQQHFASPMHLRSGKEAFQAQYWAVLLLTCFMHTAGLISIFSISLRKKGLQLSMTITTQCMND